jgi:RimJ/RimL family protein N-acetyltransferase
MFNRQQYLESTALSLRPLMADDLEGLFTAASDPLTWADHPAHDRYQKAVFQNYFEVLLNVGGTLVIIDKSTDKIIGCSAYYTAPDRPDTISIGFTFLHHSYWGGKTNFAAKSLMLGHAFAHFPEVWFHIGPQNIRSQTATTRLGAEWIEDATLNLGGTPAPWKTYKLTQAAWEKRSHFTS